MKFIIEVNKTHLYILPLKMFNCEAVLLYLNLYNFDKYCATK